MEIEIGFLEQREPFRDRLHHSVFDPVVRHFHKMSCAGFPYVKISSRHRENLKKRLELFHHFCFSSHHKRSAVSRSAATAGNSSIDKRNSQPCQLPGPYLCRLVMRVPSVYHHISPF